MYFMTQVPLPRCTCSQVILFCTSEEQSFLCGISFYSVPQTCYISLMIILGREVLSVVWGMHCPVCAGFPAEMCYCPHSSMGSCFCPPANCKQTSLSSAKWNPTSGHGLLFLSETPDFPESFSPQLFKASLDRICTAGKVNTSMTTH